MAMWSMVVLAATGDGFWNPVNLIAHTFYDEAPFDGTFDGTAALIGIAAHMMIAMSLGIAIALLANRFAHGPAGTIALALGVSMAAWLGGVVIWDAVDATAFHAFTPWVLLTGHAMFATASGGVVAAFGGKRVGAAGSGSRPPGLVQA